MATITTDPYPATRESKFWNERAEASSDQSRRALEKSPIDDSWNQLSARFAPVAEGEPEDPMITLMQPWLEPKDTVLDVGCGAGRLTVPLAGICQSIIGIDSSPTMLNLLSNQVQDRQITNLRIDESTWEEWPEETVDVVLMSRLLYAIHPIEEFLEKAHRVASRGIIVMLSTAQPVAFFHPLREAAYGESRIEPTGANELRSVLESWGIAIDVRASEPVPTRAFPDAHTALRSAVTRLNIRENTPEYDKLRVAVDEALTETSDGKFRFSWKFESVPYLFSWHTDT